MLSCLLNEMPLRFRSTFRRQPPSWTDRQDVLIDSSSLFEIFNCNLRLKKFRALLKSEKYPRRIIFTPLVFEELLDHGDKAKVVDQLLEIGKLASELGPERFAWASMPDDCFKAEASNQLQSTPVYSDPIRKELLAKLSARAECEDFVSNYCAEASTWKKETLAFEKNIQSKAQTLRKKGAPALAQGKLVAAIENYSGPTEESPWFQDCVAHSNQLAGANLLALNVIADKTRYPFLWLWSCLLELTVLGVAFPQGDQHEIAKLLKPNKGNIYDNNIGTAAALCRTLVTEDKGLIWKFKKLRELGLTSVAAISLDTFLYG